LPDYEALPQPFARDGLMLHPRKPDPPLPRQHPEAANTQGIARAQSPSGYPRAFMGDRRHEP
jgi:hypothetical protein